jgi:hypothetical protein
MADQHMGETSTIIYSGWCHAGLPHRKTPDEQDWCIQTEHLTLVVEPGKLPNKDGSTSYAGCHTALSPGLSFAISWIARSKRDAAR